MPSEHWDWEDFCGTNSSNIRVWIGEDFGHCFEQLAFMCFSNVVLATFSAYYMAVFSRTRLLLHDHVPKPFAVKVRFLLCLLLMLAPIIHIVIYYEVEDAIPPPVDLVTFGIVAFAWLLHSVSIWKLQYAYVVHIPLRGPVLLVFSYVLVLASTIVHVQTVVRLSKIKASRYFNEWEQIFCYLQASLHGIYVLTLLKNKKPISQPYLRIQTPGERDHLLDTSYARYGLPSVCTELNTTYSDVNIFEKLLFTWVRPLLKKGSNRQLKGANDLFAVPKSLSTNLIREMALDIRNRRPKSKPSRNVYVNYDDLSTSNKSMDTLDSDDSDSDELKSEPVIKSTRSMFQTLNRAFGWHYYPIGVLKVIADLAVFASPILLNYLVMYIENKNEPEKHGYFYAGGLFLASLVQAFANSQFGYHVNVVGLKVRAALVTVIYHKTLSVSSVSMATFTSGQIINFMSTDTDRIVNFCPTFHELWSLPLQVCLSLYILYNQVGLAFLAGLAFAILVIPINRWIAVKIATLSERMMGQKDARVKVVNEVLRGIRVVKYYTLEEYFNQKISRLRHWELHSLKGRKYLDALCVYLWASTPVLISVLTFSTYALLGHEVTAAKIFTSLAVFNILTRPLNAFPWVINGFMEVRVSLRRVEAFLKLSDVDWFRYYNKESFRSQYDDTVLFLDKATFSWQSSEPEVRDHSTSGGITTSIECDQSSNEVSVVPNLRGISLDVRKGQYIGVIGRVGSGKSSLFSAILAEMQKVDGCIETSSMETGFGYVSQEAWIQHGSVRENIICGSTYNMARYSAVVDACALIEDIETLPAGDMTEVGENGVTLSGGQKARISLARAVYQDKDIYLLDDPFSSVDTHVAQQIYTRCIMGMLKYKTRIVCTHHVQWLRNADWVLVFDDGRIGQCGPPSQILDMTTSLLEDSTNKKEDVEELTPPMNECTYDDVVPLVETEEQEVGSVKYDVYKAYWRAVGTCLSVLVLGSVILMQVSRNLNDWWLSYWVTHSHSNQSDDSPIFHQRYDVIMPSANEQAELEQDSTLLPWRNITQSKDNVTYYLTVYGILAVLNTLMTLVRAFTFAYGGVCAARVLHNKLLTKIIKAPVYFFDSTPLGRILNRFSSDVYAIDDTLPFELNILLSQIFALIGVLVITCYGLPWVLVLLVPLGFLYHFIQKYYRMTSREVKRIMSITLSPVYAHFSETVSGLTTIRAFRISDRFCQQNEWKYEQYQRAQYSSIAAASWFDICLQMIGVAMVTGVAFIAVLEHHFRYVNSGLVGLSLSYALSITGLLNGVVVYFTETEKQMVSVERAQQYINDVPQERQDSLLEVPPFWPLQGNVVFDRVILKYRHAMTNALDVVSFDIRSGEKVGIVGRTGSGKSSLLQAIYRMIEIQSGCITIDAINIAHISIFDLRSRLAIIPQDPYLFSGTVRENLDPHNKYNDSSLWNVLGKCHVTIAVDRCGGLDGEVSEGGKHFSVGQRQLLCLARALLAKAKILCLDEATASIDRETDDLIQETIRYEFSELTVLTIAHRISTVMDCDRILVMSGGRVAEYAPPGILLKRSNSIFASLVQNSQT